MTDLEKNKKNAVLASKLKVGDKVRVIKSNETGVVDKIIPYNRDDCRSPYGYSAIQIRFDNYDKLPHHRKVRRYSALSLKKI